MHVFFNSFQNIKLTFQISFTLLIFLLSLNLAQSQNSNGKISGTVTDRKSGLPIESVDVTLLKQRDSSIVTGTNTDINGNFVLNNLSDGKYKIIVKIIGHNILKVSGLVINQQKNEIVLDTIKLTSGTEFETSTIEIESEKSKIQFSGDKKIFNVGDDISNVGGNALDVLKNVPSILVDVDGNISLRGSQNVKILVDGKPFGLEGANRNAVLQQIPANTVESIELITNPSAKYDPEGTSGILNIVLKKNSDFGYNGNLNLNAGTQDKYSGGINLNIKNSKINIFGSYNITDNFNEITGTSQRQNLFKTESEFINQITSGNVSGINNLIKGGLEYSINPKNSLALNLNFGNRNADRYEVNDYDYLNNAGETVQSYITNNNTKDNGYNYDMSLNYNSKFSKPNQTLYGEVTYSKTSGESVLNSAETYYIPVNETPGKLNNYLNDKSDLLNFQLDYVMPFGKEIKFETGAKSIFRKNDNDFRSESYDYNLNSYIPEIASANQFIYNENINSVYAIISDKIKDFSYSFGGRAENTNTNGELLNNNIENVNNYFDFFPSASISQKLTGTQEVQLTYSRRINRPNIRNLNPFVDETDPGNIRVGNPFLKPDYTDAIELSYINYLPFATVTPSFFYRNTTDEISRYRFVTDSNITVTTFLNLDNSFTYGLDFILNTQILKWWSANGNFSFYKSEVNADNITPGLTNETNSWSARASTSLNFPDLFDMQVSYIYTGKRISAIGEVQPIQSVDLAFKKDLLDNKLSLGLRVSDLFNSLKFAVNINAENYNQQFTRKRDNRAAFLTLTYNFGVKDKSQNKRGNKSDRKEREQRGDEGF